MPLPIIKGTTDPQLQHWTLDFSRQSGNKLSREFKGASIEKMAALANQYGAARWDGSLKYEHNVATLAVSTGNASAMSGSGIASPVVDITDKWELLVEPERPDLCENANFRSLFAVADGTWAPFTGSNTAVSDQVFQLLRSAASSDTATITKLWEDMFKTKLVDFLGRDLEGTDITLGTIMVSYNIYAYNFVADYLRGQKSFIRGKYVLRHTTNAPDDYADNIADFNVERIYSKAQLLSECESSLLWIFPLPGYLAYKINAMSGPVAAPANYLFGGLKSASSAVTAARNRIDIVTDYAIDTWPVHTYGTI